MSKAANASCREQQQPQQQQETNMEEQNGLHVCNGRVTILQNDIEGKGNERKTEYPKRKANVISVS